MLEPAEAAPGLADSATAAPDLVAGPPEPGPTAPDSVLDHPEAMLERAELEFDLSGSALDAPDTVLAAAEPAFGPTDFTPGRPEVALGLPEPASAQQIPAQTRQEPAGFSGRPGARQMAYREPADLTRVRAFAGNSARSFGLAAIRADLLTLAVSELATNTLQHTAGGGRIRLWAATGHVYCEVTDHGPMRAFGRDMPAADAVRGRGLAIVERLCDDVTVTTTPAGTAIRLTFNL